MLTLQNVKQNIPVKIKSLLESDEVTCRLQELGFLPGTLIQLTHKLPFNGPLAVLVQGAKIALRHEDAARVLVEPMPMRV